MDEGSTLQLSIKLQDQMSATVKTLGQTLEGLAKSASVATDALKKQTDATNGVAKAADSFSVKAQLLDTLHAKFAGTLGDAQKAMDKYAAGAGVAGEFLTKMGVGGVAAAAAVGLLVEKGYDGVAAFSSWERAARKFDEAMKATGQGAKTTFAQLNQDARGISRGTIFSDSVVTDAMARLARNGVLTMEKVRQITPQVLDIAAGTGRSVGDVASDVNRLYANPSRALQLMSRSNPNMNSSDRQRLEDRVKSGDGEGVANDVLKKMAAPATGQAALGTKGIAGAYAELQKNLGDWESASSKSYGKMISDALHLESVLHGLNKVVEINKEAAENRFRGLTAATPEDRIAGANQAIRDQQSNPLGYTAGLAAADSGSFGMVGASMGSNARIAEQRKIIEDNEELLRKHNNDNARSNSAVQRKIDLKAFDASTDTLNQNDPMSAKIKKLTLDIASYQNGLQKAAGDTTGAFDSAVVDRMTAALVRTKNELDSLKDGFDAVKAAIPAEIYAAGLSPSQASFNNEYTKMAASVGGKYSLDANQLSLDPATRAANPNSMAPDQFKSIMDELMSLTISKLEQMGNAQFNRDQMARSQEAALILRAMQPGAAGQRASAELEAYRSTKTIYGSNQRGQAYNAELNSKTAQDAYKNQIEMQQQLQRFSLQADQARLQIALMTGGSATISQGTFNAGGSANASAISAQLRGKYGASDTAVAAVLGHFQQESGLDPTKEHMDSNGYVSKGLGQWQKDRATNLESFAGVSSGGQATTEQQIDFMMKEILSNPKFRAMWAKMNSGGISLDDATDAFGSYEGYGDNSGGARRANARKFMSGGSVSFETAGPVGEDLAKRQAGLLPQAQDLAQKFGIPVDDALRTLMGADAQTFSAENDAQLRSMTAANRSGAALNTAQAAGGSMGRQRAQWGLDAYNKGFTGPQGAAYLDARQETVNNDNTKILLDKLQSQKESYELANKEADLAGASTAERQKELDLFKLAQEAKRAGYDTDSQAYKAQVDAISKTADAQERLRRSQGPLGSWLADSKDDWKTWEDASVSAISATESGFANILTGTNSLSDGVSNLIKNFANLAANAAFKSLFGTVGNDLFSSGGGLLSGLIGGGGGNVGATGATAVAGGELDTQLASHAFANGGIMTSMGSLPLRRYATGGVATTPQLALFGEGSHNEAYVPLPDGRSIPVTMGGGGGGTNNVVAPQINVTVQSGGGNGNSGGGGQSADPKQIGEMVGAAVHAKIIEAMTQESRTGGALNPVYG